MSQTTPVYPVREATNLIVKCNSVTEIEFLKGQLVRDINKYHPADQGFLLAMLGLQISKITTRITGHDCSLQTLVIISSRHHSDN